MQAQECIKRLLYVPPMYHREIFLKPLPTWKTYRNKSYMTDLQYSIILLSSGRLKVLWKELWLSGRTPYPSPGPWGSLIRNASIYHLQHGHARWMVPAELDLAWLEAWYTRDRSWKGLFHQGVDLLRSSQQILPWAGIFKKSMGARHRVGIGLSYRPARLHRLAELMPWHRFLGSIKV